MLGSEYETMFCDTWIFSGRLPVNVLKTLNYRQSNIFFKNYQIEEFQSIQTVKDQPSQQPVL